MNGWERWLYLVPALLLAAVAAWLLGLAVRESRVGVETST